MLKVRRGEIWLAKLNGNGSVQRGKRPGIIVSNEASNKFSPIVNLIPITSEINKTKIPVHVELGKECGLHKPSIALVEQDITIDKSDLIKKVGECTNEVIEKINKAINIQKQLVAPIDMMYIRKLCIAIEDTIKLITKCKTKGIEYENCLFEQGFLISDLKNYCEKYNTDYKKFLYKYVNANIDINLKTERLRMVL